MKNIKNSTIEQSLNTVATHTRWIALVISLAILLSGITFVQPGEAAMVLRFGKLAGATPSEQILEPGFHFAFPYLIDKVIRVPVEKVQEVKIDELFTNGSITDVTKNGYALTGDNNVVLISAVLKYKITDPIQFALETEDPENHLLRLATSALTYEIAKSSVDGILVNEKKEIQDSVLADIQRRADQINLGVSLIALEFISLQPPREVKADFDLVTSTYINKETLIQEAKSYQEKEILNASTQRDAMIRASRVEAIAMVAAAKDNVSQFHGVIGEYQKNPQVIHSRLYQEKVEKILSQVSGKIILPAGESADNILLP